METTATKSSNVLLKVKKIWAKVEIPFTILILILISAIAIYSIVKFNTNSISVKQLEHLYVTKLQNTELVWLLVSLVRNGIIWISINLLGKNIIFAAIALILVPRIIALPFSNRVMHATAMQGVLKLEHFKLKKFYIKASEDAEVKQMYTQDSMRLPKKFGIVTTENMAAQMLSFIPVILVSWAVSNVIGELRKSVHSLTSGGIDMTKPFLIFAIVMVIVMAIQTWLPLKNAHGPTADQQKQMMLIGPAIMFFMFLQQPAIIPMVWSVSYLMSLLPVLYYYRIKKYSREDILNRP